MWGGGRLPRVPSKFGVGVYVLRASQQIAYRHYGSDHHSTFRFAVGTGHKWHFLHYVLFTNQHVVSGVMSCTRNRFNCDKSPEFSYCSKCSFSSSDPSSGFAL